MILDEYRRSLKMPEAEEFLDLIFFRPVAYAFVKLIYRLPITPNQVTFLSMVCGCIAGWLLAGGEAGAMQWAAVWYATANILDCSDGQLARLQGSGTLLGRVVDGVADYVSSVAIFLGIGTGLGRTGGGADWWLVVGAGVSSALQAILFDHYQSEFISTVRSERNFLEREVETFSAEISRLRRERRGPLRRIVLGFYLAYLRVQERLNTKKEKQQFESGTYAAANRLMIRIWSLLGPTTNRSLLMVCAAAGAVRVYLWIVLIPANLLLTGCLIAQRRIHRRLQAE